jgi:hypothetical protein
LNSIANINAKLENAKVKELDRPLTVLRSVDTSPNAVVALNAPIQNFRANPQALAKLNSTFFLNSCGLFAPRPANSLVTGY